jgi:hypothetical protein
MALNPKCAAVLSPRADRTSYGLKAFLTGVPDLKITVVQRLVVGDRVVSHLRFTGHFAGTFQGVQGHGQLVDFIATDILCVQDGRITDNWRRSRGSLPRLHLCALPQVLHRPHRCSISAAAMSLRERTRPG